MKFTVTYSNVKEWLLTHSVREFVCTHSPRVFCCTKVDRDLIDRDGNIYSTIVINSQEWTVQNLRTIHYADGSHIANLPLQADWAADTAGGYVWPNNLITSKEPWGAIYNGYAIDKGIVRFTKSGVLQTGWRVPTVADWIALTAYLGGSAVAGGKLKEIGITHWRTPNLGASDLYGFKVLGSTTRGANGVFGANGDFAFLYGGAIDALTYSLDWFTFSNAILTVSTVSKNCGCSVRCVRDI